MKLNSYILAVLVFVLLFGGIGIASAMNMWHTETQKVPVKYSSGEAAGEYNPADIRGSYAFGDVSDLFDIPLADLQAAFRIPTDTDPAAYQLKSLEEQFSDLDVEMGTGSVRMFVAFYKGLPYALADDEDTYLFAEAVEILQQQGNLTSEQSDYLASHTLGQEIVQVEATVVAPESAEQAPVTEHEPEDFLVTGKTSFQNLLDWGVPEETIVAVLGEDIPAPQILVKDFATSKGIAFSELKGQLQAEVDKYK